MNFFQYMDTNASGTLSLSELKLALMDEDQ